MKVIQMKLNDMKPYGKNPRKNDSAIFLPIVFVGVLPVSVIIPMAITQVLLKVGYEILILPLTKVIVKKVVAYEEKNQ